MANIVERTVLGETSKRCELITGIDMTNAIMRKMSWGSTWNELRIGIRLSTSVNSTITTNVPVIQLSACNYNESNIFANQVGGQNWGVITDATDFSNTQMNGYRFQNSAFTGGSSPSTATNWMAKNTTAISGLIVSLVRSSGNVLVSIYTNQVGTALNVSITPSKFADSMLGASVNTTANNFAARGGSQSFAINESTYGALNAICVNWTGALNTCEVLDCMVRKIS